MAILNTANSHHIHLLVAEQIPDFVRDDHPVFVEFIEKYYEFLAQANTGILTSVRNDVVIFHGVPPLNFGKQIHKSDFLGSFQFPPRFNSFQSFHN